ncbi:MAG: hypothetical protein H6732_12035 [Alphaproteobacteria bacterium]|nr:hypothetical protein [Alphaproteobacteria bacterium]
MSRQDLDSALDAPPVPTHLAELDSTLDDLEARPLNTQEWMLAVGTDPMDAPEVPDHLLGDVLDMPVLRTPPRRARPDGRVHTASADLDEPPSFADDDFQDFGDALAAMEIEVVARPDRREDRTLAFVSGGMVLSLVALVGMLLTQ